jgi:hypothetical protein
MMDNDINVVGLQKLIHRTIKKWQEYDRFCLFANIYTCSPGLEVTLTPTYIIKPEPNVNNAVVTAASALSWIKTRTDKWAINEIYDVIYVLQMLEKQATDIYKTDHKRYFKQFVEEQIIQKAHDPYRLLRLYTTFARNDEKHDGPYDNVVLFLDSQTTIGDNVCS